MNKKILFVGGGNMASSIIEGLISNDVPSDNIMVSDPDTTRLSQLVADHQIKTSTDNNEFIADCAVIVLAVKPQVLKNIVAIMKDSIQKHKPPIISIAAGINTTSLKKWLGSDTSIIRAMPNTPALLQLGITGMFADKTLAPAVKDLAQAIMHGVGDVIWVEDENLINSITAISGSGPAYFFLLFEAMQDAAVNLGLDKKTAKKLITKTALGATAMASSEQTSFANLRENVTSPGGTTEQALSVFAAENFNQIVDKALSAAYTRSIELAKELGK